LNRDRNFVYRVKLCDIDYTFTTIKLLVGSKLTVVKVSNTALTCPRCYTSCSVTFFTSPD